MREHLKWSNTKLLWPLLVFLRTQTWAKLSHAPVTNSDNKNDTDEDCSLAEVRESVEYIDAHFRLPLEAKWVSIVTLQDEVEEAVEYAAEQLYKVTLFLPRSCNWTLVVRLQHYQKSQSASQKRVSATKPRSHTRRTRGAVDTWVVGWVVVSLIR